MSSLSTAEILELIKTPKNGVFLNRAVDHEKRIQIHSEPIASHEDHGIGHHFFLEWVKDIVSNKKKFARFQQFLRFPYFTNDIVDSIFNQLSKVFDSRNSFRKYDFKTPSNEQDFIAYLADISDAFFWRTEVFESIKNNINSVVVIDMRPTESTQPEPYSYVVKTDMIIDMDNTVIRNTTVDKKLFKRFKTEYLIFKDVSGRIIALDDDFYRSFKFDDQKQIISEPEIEIPHQLGYCPAAQIYSDPFNSKDNIRKKGPISTTISDLDFVLYYETFKRYSDSFVPNPITVKYAEECNYVADNGVSCDGGKLMVQHHSSLSSLHGTTDGFHFVACPKCNEDSMVGPGEMLEVNPPRNREEFDQLDAIHFVMPPLEGIEYTSKDIARRIEDIMLRTVGVTDEQFSGQAKNIPQILGGFETRKTILRNIAVNIEIIKKFTHQTIARLRYSNDFEGCSIFEGDEFFLETEKQLFEKYAEEKANGNSEFELSLSRDKITETKHKNNPNLLQRAKFLSFIEPYQGQTFKEIQSLKKDNPTLINDIDFVIKINFDSFVKRFEVEVEPIGSLLSSENSRQDNIKTVQDKFIEYANETLIIPGGEGVEGGVINVTGESRPDIEAEAKARLKGSVGGVQGILEIQKAVSDGITSKAAALVILDKIFGFDKETSLGILQGKVKIVE